MTMKQWLELTKKAKPITSKKTAAQIIRELRDERSQ
jgi:hypothetical protein